MTVQQYINEYGLITSIIGGLIVLLVYLNYKWANSYFKEKGKNLATKEDIQEITKITETIKGDLAVFSQDKSSLILERRKTILKMMKIMQDIEHAIRFDKTYIESLETKPNIIMANLFNYECILNELVLYIDNDQVAVKLNDLLSKYSTAARYKNQKNDKFEATINDAISLRNEIEKLFRIIIRTDLT